MQFLTFEDETGLIETVFFPDVYRRFSQSIDWGRPYLLDGLVEENFGAVTLTVERAFLLPKPACRAENESQSGRLMTNGTYSKRSQGHSES